MLTLLEEDFFLDFDEDEDFLFFLDWLLLLSPALLKTELFLFFFLELFDFELLVLEFFDFELLVLELLLPNSRSLVRISSTGALPATMVVVDAATISAEDTDAPAPRRARQVGRSPTRIRKVARRMPGPAAARLRPERRALISMVSSGGMRVAVVFLGMRLFENMMKGEEVSQILFDLRDLDERMLLSHGQ